MTGITELAQRLKLEVHRAVSDFNPQMNIKTRDLKELVEALEKAQQERDELRSRLKLERSILGDADKRIAELEESNAQVIQSRDHYKRMTEEGLKQLAESRTVTVKLPESFKLAKSSSGLRYYYADEVDAALTAAGIKVEAE